MDTVIAYFLLFVLADLKSNCIKYHIQYCDICNIHIMIYVIYFSIIAQSNGWEQSHNGKDNRWGNNNYIILWSLTIDMSNKITQNGTSLDRIQKLNP